MLDDWTFNWELADRLKEQKKEDRDFQKKIRKARRADRVEEVHRFEAEADLAWRTAQEDIDRTALVMGNTSSALRIGTSTSAMMRERYAMDHFVRRDAALQCVFSASRMPCSTI
jgi:chromatin segregation and condensation protein Rec8/ScpA/Scc1 (kleisin family)